jgi:poly-gamma-glutamate synthesis protein (capsule biosynthesis protein)
MRACRRLSIRLILALASLGVLPVAVRAQGTAPHAPPVPRQQKLLFVGDIMLSRSVGRKMAAEQDWTHPFEKIASTLRAADLTFANLECPISDKGRDRHHLYSFRADPRAIEGLKFAGFDVVSLANNHADDWGPAALMDTVERLRAAGIRPVGAGANDLDAHYPAVVNLHGVRLAFLAYVEIPPESATAGPASPGVAWLEPDRVMEDIRFARRLADVVIVSLHWGIEYQRKPQRRQVEMAHEMIDAGADLVVGSHPHVVQPLEQYHGHWIAYSLGNFIFDQHDPPTHHGLMLDVALKGKQIAAVEPVAITIVPGYQAVLTNEDTTTVAAQKHSEASAQ